MVRHRTSENPDPIDIHVGQQLRRARQSVGMSQTKLGESGGLSFQQIQKYESGKNRIAASRLYRIAESIGLPVAYFFEGLDNGGDTHAEGSHRKGLELVRYFFAIRDPACRERVFQLAKTLANSDGGANREKAA